MALALFQLVEGGKTRGPYPGHETRKGPSSSNKRSWGLKWSPKSGNSPGNDTGVLKKAAVLNTVTLETQYQQDPPYGNMVGTNHILTVLATQEI